MIEYYFFYLIYAWIFIKDRYTAAVSCYDLFDLIVLVLTLPLIRTFFYTL